MNRIELLKHLGEEISFEYRKGNGETKPVTGPLNGIVCGRFKMPHNSDDFVFEFTPLGHMYLVVDHKHYRVCRPRAGVCINNITYRS